MLVKCKLRTIIDLRFESQRLGDRQLPQKAIPATSLPETEREKLVMKLYIIRGAPNARKAEAVVHHLGIDLEFVELDILTGQHKKEPYLTINPNGLVPTLVEEDFVLWESHAIMIYLAERVGAESLYPNGLRKRADANRWLSWSQAQFGRAAGQVS